MKLLVDIGNSRIKYCFSESGKLFEHKAFDYACARLEQTLENVFDSEPCPDLNRILVSSVAGEDANSIFHNWCHKTYNLDADFAKVVRQFGDLEHAYHDIGQFGIDRWLAMIAARHSEHRDCLVVDCGTATTIDAISASGQHLGGMITPGAALMIESLLNNTQEIRDIVSECRDTNSVFGRSTHECLALGARQSVIALIETVYHHFQQQSSSKAVCLITGGAAAGIIGDMNIEFKHLPHLVVQGLDIWGQAR